MTVKEYKLIVSYLNTIKQQAIQDGTLMEPMLVAGFILHMKNICFMFTEPKEELVIKPVLLSLGKWYRYGKQRIKYRGRDEEREAVAFVFASENGLPVRLTQEQVDEEVLDDNVHGINVPGIC